MQKVIHENDCINIFPCVFSEVPTPYLSLFLLKLQVKPVLNRVKITLIGLAVALVTCALLFINIENPRDSSESSGVRAIAGAYNDESARSFEPDAFCGEPDLS